MNYINKLLVAVLSLTFMPAHAADKKTETSLVKRVYIFGFAASFNDSTVYLTEIQPLDSAFINPNNSFLMGRDNYGYQLRDFLAQKFGKNDETCVVMFDEKRKNVEKKYASVMEKYKKEGAYRLQHVTPTDFAFKAIDMTVEYVEEEQKPINEKKLREEAKKAQKEQKAKLKAERAAAKAEKKAADQAIKEQKKAQKAEAEAKKKAEKARKADEQRQRKEAARDEEMRKQLEKKKNTEK